MRPLALLWPVSSKATTAAAARLSGFQQAATKLGITSRTIVPLEDRAPDKVEGTTSLRLYDSLAPRGLIVAMCSLPQSTLDLIRVLRREKVGCVVASTPSPFIPFQGVVAAMLLHIPFVLDVRDSWEMEAFTHEGAYRNKAKEYIEGWVARRARSVWFVTNTLRARVAKKYRLAPSATSLVPNGADLSLFHFLQTQRTVDLMFVGSPARYRNVRGVFECLSVLRQRRPNVKAVFVGWLDDPDSERILSEARTLGLASNVELRSHVSRGEVPAMLSSARLGIVSLSKESAFRAAIGAKAYEYMACGLPLACLGPSGESELRTLVESREVGFFATNASDFAAKAEILLNDQAHWEELSRHCVVVSREFDRVAICEHALRETILPLIANSPEKGAT